ncbi:DUF2971 domain-containing protein [Pseudomonas sp. Pseusp11]|uniref:DUF2971 domain-containing protein n=1 Tax=Pseudomonas sp. Pseusp11 TaxID=3243003 RepID=UPI0039B6924C
METVPRTLYKYVTPERVDILKNLKIRFTQPFALNDPFEFNLSFQEIISEKELFDKVSTLDPDLMIRQTLEKLSEPEQAALKNMPPEFHEFLIAKVQQLTSLENIKKINNEYIRPHTDRIKSEISLGLNKHIGILSLSSNCSIPPMWANYADNSKGFIIGFDTTNQFFNRRRSESDELYHLRKVVYEDTQPLGSVSEVKKDILIQKNKSWEYENEWRMLLPLSAANAEISTPAGDNVFLFDLPANAISQIIFGLNTEDSTISEVTKAISEIAPNPHVKLSRATKGAIGLEIVEL